MKINAVVLAALFTASTFAAPRVQDPSLLQKAREAYNTAQSLETDLSQKAASQRLRDDYLRVVKAYQRVYMLTPHTSYADDALIAIAKLYEETKAKDDAVKTLQFLISQYPTSPFKENAERDIARLTSTKPQKTVVVAVDNVRFWEAQNSVRVIVELGGEITFKQGDAKNPARVFVDISPAKLNSLLIGKQWSVESDLLQTIRVGQYDASTVRVVLHLGNVGKVTSFTLRDPDRLIIDVLATEVVAPPATPAAPTTGTTKSPIGTITANVPPQPKPASSTSATTTTPPVTPALATVTPVPVTPTSATPAPVTPTPVPSDAAAPSAPSAAGKKSTDAEVKTITAAKTSGTPSLVRSLGLKLSRVVIDAGHGGHDTGSVGPAGYAEKELVLDVAKRLKQLIETEIGAEVVMTRTDDSFVPLEARTALANDQQADLFISIHANSSRVKSVRGVETYFLSFTSSREALETASRENAASQRSIHELQDLVKKIMLQDKVDESRQLAQHVARAMAARKGSGVDRGVKQAPFVVLIGANMPSILAEICFISNPQDEKQLRNAPNRQAIAESLLEGVKSYAESLSGTKTATTQEKTN